MTDARKDVSRPTFHRPPGQVGVYITIYNAAPENEKDVGSEHFYFMDLTDRLFEEFDALPLDKLRVDLVTRGVVDRAILEGFKQGIILGVGFDDAVGLETLWSVYQSGQLGKIVQELLITPQLLSKVKAKHVQLATKVYEDEYNACREEIHSGKIPTFSLADKENDQKMIKKVKEYQKGIATTLLSIRDELTNCDHNLGEFLLVLKRNLPHKVDEIKTYKELDAHMRKMKEASDVNTKPFEAYKKLHKHLNAVMLEIQKKVCQPLAQVHAMCETQNQRELKAKISTLCATAKKYLKLDYNVTELKHPDWQVKILYKEQKLFMGIVSLLPVAVDAFIDMDECLDEYLSGVELKI